MCLAFAALAVLGTAGLAAAAEPNRERIAAGREIFLREWTPADSRSHGGDGLGPVYNDTSCVACHNAGGTGGAGPTSKNVDIVTAFANSAQRLEAQPGNGFFRGALMALGFDVPEPPRPSKPRKPDTTELIKTHAGFRTARSVVLHKFGTDPNYDTWRSSLAGNEFFGFAPSPPPFSIGGFVSADVGAEIELNRTRMQIRVQSSSANSIGEFSVVRSHRNPPALFGSGLIDSIPDRVLESAAKVRHPDFPEVVGRVSRLKDGKIGHFGWKGQTPSLNDFVLTACAVELGLEVPGHHQGGLPQVPEAKAKGLDLTDDECSALIAYVRGLPKPLDRQPSGESEARDLAAGKHLFNKVGCAACHTPKLGDVEGIYSDLLLHDMGPDLADTGQYGVFVPDLSEPDFVDPEQPIADSLAGTPVVVGGAVNDLKELPKAIPVQLPAVPPPPPLVAPQAQAVSSFEVAPEGQPAKVPTGPALRQEWRTPPLWGFRDSGPYMHDGRAETLDQAIALHGGQAQRSARLYFALKPEERFQVQVFLKSLVAPTEQLARAAD